MSSRCETECAEGHRNCLLAKISRQAREVEIQMLLHVDKLKLKEWIELQGMEPEIQRLIAKHKTELQAEREKGQDSARYDFYYQYALHQHHHSLHVESYILHHLHMHVCRCVASV